MFKEFYEGFRAAYDWSAALTDSRITQEELESQPEYDFSKESRPQMTGYLTGIAAHIIAHPIRTLNCWETTRERKRVATENDKGHL